MRLPRVRHDLVTKQQQPEQTFFQRLYTDGQKAREKMLNNITNHKRNGNQNHNKMAHHTPQNAYHPKVSNNKFAKDVKKREP